VDETKPTPKCVQWGSLSRRSLEGTAPSVPCPELIEAHPVANVRFRCQPAYTGEPYRLRKPRASPLWQCLSRYFHAFLAAYEYRFQPRYGFLRPIIPEVVDKFMGCVEKILEGKIHKFFGKI